MDAKKCDICGAFYVSNIWNKIGATSARLGTSGTWTDCCPECVAKIQEVIDQRTGINKEKKDEKTI